MKAGYVVCITPSWATVFWIRCPFQKYWNVKPNRAVFAVRWRRLSVRSNNERKNRDQSLSFYLLVITSRTPESIMDLISNNTSELKYWNNKCISCLSVSQFSPLQSCVQELKWMTFNTVKIRWPTVQTLSLFSPWQSHRWGVSVFRIIVLQRNELPPHQFGCIFP